MTFCGNDIQRENFIENIYVAEELWSLFYYTDLHNKNSIYKILDAEKKYAKPKEMNMMERRTKL